MKEQLEAADHYPVDRVEAKWRERWDERNLYRAECSKTRPKYYCLEQFPYPSGHLHMGHVRVYTLGDVIARYRRMVGYTVLHPMGWDAFGLPAENAAIKSGVPPRVSTLANIAYMKQQMRQMGLSFDWDREVTTCLPDYYRFTQELFLLFFERGLAYQREGAVNWCPGCETVLANEQVEDGRCWRCDSVVVKRDLRQWYFRITQYADRLLEGLNAVDWPADVKIQQINWIGRSEGAEVQFELEAVDASVSVFTTRPDTLFGATYLVLAPEHRLVEPLIEGRQEAQAVREFVARERQVSDMERTQESGEKRGIFTGSYAIHPLTGAKIPVWIGNYVLADYGTGAVMGVPAHDQRDFLFANQYGLTVTAVVSPESLDEPVLPFLSAGTLIQSGPFTGMESVKAKRAIAEALQEANQGGPRVTYRMRDWLISRQRYWGAPIPIIHCPSCGPVAVPREQLPVLLPDNVEFTGLGGSPLAQTEDFVQVPCPQCGQPARRETDTMDTFVDSSWYYLRYASEKTSERPFDRKDVDYWMPVDEYVGGKEHAILHMLYSRFFTKVLHDAGLVAVEEPFNSLLVQGMVVLGGAKMSKSKGNSLSPEEILGQWGSDATRVFMLFAAPPDKDFEWSKNGVEGAHRFLQRVFRLVTRPVAVGGSDREAAVRLNRRAHRTIKKVGEDLGDRRAFNTAVSALMEFTNALYQEIDQVSPDSRQFLLETLVLLLAPLAPYLAEELWEHLGHQTSVHEADWPVFDPAQLVEDAVEIAIQVNGKVRARMVVGSDWDRDAVEQAVLAHADLTPYLQGHAIKKVVVIPARLVNVVVA